MNSFLAALWFRWFGRDDIVSITTAGGSRVGRVKAWGRRGRRYYVGDAVPHMNNHSTYCLKTTEGWFANCAKGRLVSWSVKPISSYVVSTTGKTGIRVFATPRRKKS